MLFLAKKINSKFRPYVCAERRKFSKKGVSEMIGYILLITIGIAMSIIVFTWLKGYVPTEAIECSEGVSLFIRSYTCEGNILTIELKNNGRFSVSGYLIHATTQEGQELATQDLSGLYTGTTLVGNGEIKFGSLAGENQFTPSSEEEEQVVIHIFDLSSAEFQVYSVEIVPTRYEIIKEKPKLATCTKAKIKQDIICLE